MSMVLHTKCFVYYMQDSRFVRNRHLRNPISNAPRPDRWIRAAISKFNMKVAFQVAAMGYPWKYLVDEPILDKAVQQSRHRSAAAVNRCGCGGLCEKSPEHLKRHL